MTASSDELRYPDRAQEVTSLTLAAAPAAVSRARQFARFALSARGLGGLADDAELVVSELVTNAVQASETADPDGRDSDRGPVTTIRVRVLAYQAGVVIEVWDNNPGSPVRRDAVVGAEGGRGLVIVAALCRDWGYFHTADGDKVVWADLAVPAQPLAPAGCRAGPAARLPLLGRGWADPRSGLTAPGA